MTSQILRKLENFSFGLGIVKHLFGFYFVFSIFSIIYLLLLILNVFYFSKTLWIPPPLECKCHEGEDFVFFINLMVSRYKNNSWHTLGIQENKCRKAWVLWRYRKWCWPFSPVSAIVLNTYLLNTFLKIREWMNAWEN